MGCSCWVSFHGIWEKASQYTCSVMDSTVVQILLGLNSSDSSHRRCKQFLGVIESMLTRKRNVTMPNGKDFQVGWRVFWIHYYWIKCLLVLTFEGIRNLVDLRLVKCWIKRYLHRCLVVFLWEIWPAWPSPVPFLHGTGPREGTKGRKIIFF